ncbi:MAG: phosphatidate cytidylyltransferase [Treponema sp.]|nr:phosphatidate cytidylyltransferase [Treponema sp.]
MIPDSRIARAQYRNSIKKEFFRKSIHLCSALIPTLLAVAYWPILACLGCMLCAYIVSELFRMHGKPLPVIARVTEAASRKRDENKFVLGPVTLVLGIIVTALIWKGDAARIGIYALAFGDGLASLAGKILGRMRVPFTRGKTVVGSLTCFVAVFCSAFAVCKDARIALILAGTAMVVELMPLKDFDNLIIPIVIGGIAQLLLYCQR